MSEIRRCEIADILEKVKKVTVMESKKMIL